MSDPKHGPLTALLVTLTVVTGLVDAVSILSLGRVFVANMTGNVVFIAFALAGAPGFSLSASLFALGCFLVGAFVGGVVIARTGSDRSRLFLRSVVLELILLGAAAAMAQAAAVPYDGLVKDGVTALTAIAMGIQNAAARRLAVPDLMTTLLTMTLTGFASDVRAHNRATVTRRLLAVAGMVGGAVLGAVLVDRVRPSAALDVAAGLLAIVALAGGRATQRGGTWRSA